MFNLFERPQFHYGIKVIESSECMQAWQLDDWTKELMGYEWVEKFNKWAEVNLPKQPACYVINNDTLVTHPSIAEELRDYTIKQHEERQARMSMMVFNFPVLVNDHRGIIATNYFA